MTLICCSLMLPVEMAPGAAHQQRVPRTHGAEEDGEQAAGPRPRNRRRQQLWPHGESFEELGTIPGTGFLGQPHVQHEQRHVSG